MEKNRIPKLRFSEFQGEWKQVSLREISNIYDGTHQTPKYVDKGVKFVSVENIDDLSKTEKYITPEAFQKGFKIKPQKDDILMTRITAGIIGATAIVENNNPLAYYVSLALIRKFEGVDTLFLSQNINTVLFKKELNKRIIHVAFPKKINLGDIGDCKISITSLPEQEKIASFLTVVDKRIALLTKKKAQLEEYKKGVMQQLFSQQIRFTQANGTPYPDWEEKKLGEVASFLKDGSHASHTDKKDSGYYLLSAKNIRNGRLVYGDEDRQISKGEYERIYKNYNLKSGDILLTIVGTIGEVCIFRSNENLSFQRSVAFLRFDNENSEFMYQYFSHSNFQNELIKKKVVSAQPGIYLGDISKIQLLLPSLPEQQKIAAFLSAIDERIATVTQQITQTQTWKQGLLQKMFV